MARGRMLSKSLSTSRKRAGLWQLPTCPACGFSIADFALALYPLLVAHADDFGRLDGEPLTIKNQIDPACAHTVEQFDAALDALAGVGLVQRYAAAVPADDENDDAGALLVEQQFLRIVRFDRHQYGLHKRTVSKFPAPPKLSKQFPPAQEIPDGVGNPPESLASRARAELNRTELKDKNAARTPPARKARPVEKSPPDVAVLAAMIRADVLPLHLSDPADVVEAAKSRAAKLHLSYDGRSIASAIASAIAQTEKGVHA